MNALEALEEAIALGAKTTSFQGQVVSWDTLEEAKEIVSHLQNRIEEIKSGTPRNDGVKIFRFVAKRGW